MRAKGNFRMQLFEIYRNYQSDFARFARSLTNHRESAEDLVQSAYLKSLDQVELFDTMHPEQIKAWFFTTIKRTFIDDYRKQKRIVLYDEFAENEAPETLEADFALKSALEDLPESTRKLVTMRYVMGYNSNEIAEITGTNPSTVRSRLSLATKQLQDALREEY
ncbi:MAG: RNA polymerase sigma factor [Clostridiales bacterium]|nr:RNA polymerase sigma factor [Clostridiales bacterium]